MSINQLKNRLPECAKDIGLNLTNVLSEEGAPGLTQPQINFIALACAYASKNSTLIVDLLNFITESLSESAIQAAKAAAIIMAMNNVYYRFTHLAQDKSYTKMPAKLRMNVIANPGIDKADFELACLAISSINGCGMCIDAHIHELTKAGMTSLSIQSAVRIAAVLNAVAMGIEIADI